MAEPTSRLAVNTHAPTAFLCGPELRRAAQRRNAHWGLSALFLMGLIAGFHQLELTFNVNWQRMFSAYWGGLSARAVFCAVLLYIIGFPLSRTLRPMWLRYLSQKPRFLILLLFAGAMLWEFGVALGVMVIVYGLALAELFDRNQVSLRSLTSLLRSVVLASFYL